MEINNIEEFLKLFPECKIQTFDDTKSSKKHLARILTTYNREEIQNLQNEGAGVYFAINPTTNKERSIEHLKHISALGLDLDVCKNKDVMSTEEKTLAKNKLIDSLNQLEDKPHLIIHTKNGIQPVWLFNEFKEYKSNDIANEFYRDVVEGLTTLIGHKSEGDSVIRVLRLPFTKHLKTKDDPFEISMSDIRDLNKKYDFEVFKNKYITKNPNKNSTNIGFEAQKSSKNLSLIIQEVSEYRTIKDLPLEEVIKDAASEAGINIEFKNNTNGTKQIIENNAETSGFISQNGEFCHSMSGNTRKGKQIQVVMHYLKCDKKNAKKWLINKYGIEEEPFNASDMANNVLHNNDIAYLSKTFFICTDNIWQKTAEEWLNNLIIKEMCSNNVYHNRTKINQVREYLEDYAYKKHGRSFEKKIEKREKQDNEIVLSDSILDIKTWNQRNLKKEDYLLSKLPFKYTNKKYNCPRWLQFMEEIFANDIDKNEKIKFLQEWMGYSLIADTSQEKSLILIGEGANGKSVLIAIWKKMIGFENSTSIDLSEISKEQYTAKLLGKLVNFASDIKYESQLDTGIFKKLVSGEPITGKEVYQKPIEFRNYARLIFATNNLPLLSEGGEAIRRRLHILSFNNKFTEDKQDKNLIQKLEAELEDIFLWSLDGLKELKTRGCFQLPGSVTEAVNKYLHDNDSVNSFIEEKCIISTIDSDRVSRTNLYQAYQTHCKENGFKSFNRNNFYTNIGRMNIREIKSNGTWMFTYIKLKSLGQ